MRLLGKDISTAKVLAHLEARLRARGLSEQHSSPIDLSGAEPRVDPAAFYLEAMAEHADATRALPLETHRTGMGRAVLLAKWTFRRTCQVFINETLGRQRLFNGHVRDAYAQLSADVNALKAQLAELQGPGPRAEGRVETPAPPKARGSGLGAQRQPRKSAAKKAAPPKKR